MITFENFPENFATLPVGTEISKRYTITSLTSCRRSDCGIACLWDSRAANRIPTKKRRTALSLRRT